MKSLRTIVVSIALVVAAPAAATTPRPVGVEPKQIEDLLQTHRRFADDLHRQLAANNTLRLARHRRIKALEQSVDALLEADRPIAAANLIVQHLPLFKTYFDDYALFRFIDILLAQEVFAPAKAILEITETQGDRYLHAIAAYHFAKYHFQHRHWDETLRLLEGRIADLGPKASQHALLMKGIALQAQKRHRAAIPVYEQVKPDSQYYPAARMNLAIANLRQGWWTDAHIIIDKLLENGDASGEEQINRLYLTLGYSFLYREYYRNSREAFRQVGTQSQYTNQALLGMSLSAANQQDFVGALNAVRLLQERGTRELPVYEAHFLMPFYYEKLGQFATASAGYTQAVAFFDQQIKELERIIEANQDIYVYGASVDADGRVRINDVTIDVADHYPTYLLTNLNQLKRYRPALNKLNDANLKDRFKQLRERYAALVEAMLDAMLAEEIEFLNSYKDQSRFGLARIYDNQGAGGE